MKRKLAMLLTGVAACAFLVVGCGSKEETIVDDNTAIEMEQPAEEEVAPTEAPVEEEEVDAEAETDVEADAEVDAEAETDVEADADATLEETEDVTVEEVTE